MGKGSMSTVNGHGLAGPKSPGNFTARGAERQSHHYSKGKCVNIRMLAKR